MKCVQTISGPHPAGNVGIQIHHTKPLKPNEIVWTVNAQHVITLGRLFKTGIYDPKIVISVGGSGSNKPENLRSNYRFKCWFYYCENQQLNNPVRLYREMFDR